MKPRNSMKPSPGLSINVYPEPNKTNSSYWSLRSILILTSHLRLVLPKLLFPLVLPLLKTLPPSILATCPAYLTQSSRLNHLDYMGIRWVVKTMNFLIGDSCTIPIRIPLGLKYLPRAPVYKYLNLHSSLNVRDHVSWP